MNSRKIMSPYKIMNPSYEITLPTTDNNVCNLTDFDPSIILPVECTWFDFEIFLPEKKKRYRSIDDPEWDIQNQSGGGM